MGRHSTEIGRGRMERVAGAAMTRSWGLVTVALAACLVVAARARAEEPVHAQEQMVVAANPHAAEAGIRILREGGSAVDAAIAIQLVLSLVEPQSSSIAGGAFLLYFGVSDEDGESGAPDRPAVISVYSGRERAPAAATPDMFLDADGKPMPFFQSAFGGLPVGVPGVMRMLEMAHADHGRLPWAQLFEPAIELAENGFEISPRLYFLLDRFAQAARDPAFKAHFYDSNGKAHETGYLLVNEEYAETLRLLAREGAEPMYTGELAQAIVDRVNDNTISRGRMTLEDLASYRPEKAMALCSPYREWRVCGPQLPSSGGITVQQMLGMLERFDLAAARDDRVRSIHLVAEAGRLAFADRNYFLGDPEFVHVPVAELLAPAYLRERAALIDPLRAMTDVGPGEPVPDLARIFASSPLSEVKSTSHFSIVDRFGGAVSMTTSVQSTFGSQLMVGGFILNNQLTDFSSEPEIDGRPVANRPDSRKHPLSSMAPTAVVDAQGRLHMLIGSPGGTRIINYVAQAIIGVLDWDLNIQDAVAAPHFLSQGRAVELEEGTDLESVADGLRALGHRVVSRNLNSGLHGITIDYEGRRRVLSGGVDPRREGVALGD